MMYLEVCINVEMYTRH